MLSLPLWECGLKYNLSNSDRKRFASLPLWECGLKYHNYNLSMQIFPSLPLWECGLKYVIISFLFSLCKVTPLVGVWIEILYTNVKSAEMASLPLWECGLKSQEDLAKIKRDLSLPLWECGLKYSIKFRNGDLQRSHSPCGSVD